MIITIKKKKERIEQIEKKIKWTKVDELQEIHNDIFPSYKEGGVSRNKFIILFYTYPFLDNNFPMLRGELKTFIYGRYQNDGRNYYDGKYIYLSEKVNKYPKQNTKIINVPDNLRSIIDIWIEFSKIEEGNLILNISKTRLSQILKKYLGVSTMILRKIYKDWEVSNANK